jgi:hypothetical protein
MKGMYSRIAQGWVRICGALLLLAVALLLLNAPSLNECHPDPVPPYASLVLVSFAMTATAIGFGLLYLRKWAAVAYAVASLLLGAYLMASPFRGVPSPWALNNLAIGAALIFSAAVVLRSWPLLTWRRGRLR